MGPGLNSHLFDKWSNKLLSSTLDIIKWSGWRVTLEVYLSVNIWKPTSSSASRYVEEGGKGGVPFILLLLLLLLFLLVLGWFFLVVKMLEPTHQGTKSA